MLVRVYACQNAILLEITCHGTYAIVIFYLGLLWTAPELLTSTVCPRNGTKAGDVYSFGIILHEIFYRLGTFAGKSYMTAKGKTKSGSRKFRHKFS